MTAQRDILVVEDDEAIATGLSLNLRLAGHRATVAGDGDLALTAIAERAFDLVLLDINLPRKNGLDVLAALRGADNFVPVIVLSARDGEYDKVAALRLGADDYVTKPFALAELLARVDAVLRRAQAVAAAPPVAAPERRRDDAVRRRHRRSGAAHGHARRRAGQADPPRVRAAAVLRAPPGSGGVAPAPARAVWGQSAGTPRTIDNFVGQLRKRLELDPEHPPTSSRSAARATASIRRPTQATSPPWPRRSSPRSCAVRCRATSVYEDDHVLAFLDIFPLSRGHTLVIPKEPAATLDQLSDDAAAAIGRVLPRIARAVHEGVSAPPRSTSCRTTARSPTRRSSTSTSTSSRSFDGDGAGLGLGVGWPRQQAGRRRRRRWPRRSPRRSDEAPDDDRARGGDVAVVAARARCRRTWARPSTASST
jgi:two-component system alkaline phosphatase synthesis response regulator PhoP